jgi:hypothetical protein
LLPSVWGWRGGSPLLIPCLLLFGVGGVAGWNAKVWPGCGGAGFLWGVCGFGTLLGPEGTPVWGFSWWPLLAGAV